MSNTAIVLLLYAGWTLALVTTLVSMRGLLVLSGRRKANSFDPDGTDVSTFSNRMCRAYYNCCENLPAAGAILLYAMIAGKTAVTDPLAPVLLAARVAQSTTHMISTSHAAVMIRVTFFSVQVAILFWFLVQLLTG